MMNFYKICGNTTGGEIYMKNINKSIMVLALFVIIITNKANTIIDL